MLICLRFLKFIKIQSWNSIFEKDFETKKKYLKVFFVSICVGNMTAMSVTIKIFIICCVIIVMFLSKLSQTNSQMELQMKNLLSVAPKVHGNLLSSTAVFHYFDCWIYELHCLMSKSFRIQKYRLKTVLTILHWKQIIKFILIVFWSNSEKVSLFSVGV